MKQYIFGYGSLIEKESRASVVTNEKKVLPVKIRGLERGWFARTGDVGLSTTFLGCLLTKTKSVCTNGILYEISDDDLKLTDQRENGYERVLIEHKDIEFLFDSIEESSSIWAYISQFPNPLTLEENLPSKKYPIVQSYVDICINGCLEIGELYFTSNSDEFAIDFIRSTRYWSKFWVNDRIYPRRPFIYRPNAYYIDKLIKENLEDKSIFENIYFE